MEENSSEELRKIAADQIRRARKLERSEVHDSWDRSIYDYFELFGGISSFIQYIKNVEKDGTLLDIGSGTNRAITQIANSKLGEGIKVIGTNLTKVEGVVEDTSPVKIIHTSAESLNGIENNTVNGILAAMSIAYSDTPELVVDRINEVMREGGAVKAAFWRSDFEAEEFAIKNKLKTHHQFSELLKQKNFDVAVMHGALSDIMIAIKPGGDPRPYNDFGDAYNAEQLLRLDTSMKDKIMTLEGHI